MIGDKLKELRKAKGLTINKSAEIFGIASRTYSSYESEEREPNITMLNKFADFYGVSIDYLLGRDVPPANPIEQFPTFETTTDDGTQISEKKMLEKYFSIPPKRRAVILGEALKILQFGIQWGDDEEPPEQKQPPQIKKRTRHEATIGELEDAQAARETADAQRKKNAG